MGALRFLKSIGAVTLPDDVIRLSMPEDAQENEAERHEKGSHEALRENSEKAASHEIETLLGDKTVPRIREAIARSRLEEDKRIDLISQDLRTIVAEKQTITGRTLADEWGLPVPNPAFGVGDERLSREEILSRRLADDILLLVRELVQEQTEHRQHR